ncbi:unnamed protein product [Rotaria sordida]|uniref:G-protein coupled receptors family 1 profile domain-containing protein n=2 Tax=Rotaria sordida TaxID=392033 RepID=A0A819L3V6_9BILA|nr:unnamed protein product [Rotaria sordida]CAF3954997.1 unnamed protein product [Rotaria sordida]
MSFNESDDDNIDVQSDSIFFLVDSLIHRYFIHIPLIFIIFGIIGFIGNCFTFLQPTFRSNTCCIYSLCSSFVDIITLFVCLLQVYISDIHHIRLQSTSSKILCKFQMFIFVFFPFWSLDFLLLSIIDRYAFTCSLTSYFHRITRFKMVPWIITISFIRSCILSIHSPILSDLIPDIGCDTINPLATGILYIIINGLMQPIEMLIFVLLTYKNIWQSRQRVNIVRNTNPHRFRKRIIKMISLQVLMTSLISLQWIIMHTYILITRNYSKSTKQLSIETFITTITLYLYYLNNVKSFYCSFFVSSMFRQTFIRALIKLLPEYLQPRRNVIHF